MSPALMVLVMYELEVGLSGRQSSEWRPTNCRISQPDPAQTPNVGTRAREVLEEQRLGGGKKTNHLREEKKTLVGGWCLVRLEGRPADDDAAVHRNAWAPAFRATTLT